ncbi:MAG TPA: PaaI family thioesterase [Thermoleophilaceae bacterium]
MSLPEGRLDHHDLCFGCGIANLFGLQMEIVRAERGGGVVGRFFVKQDHQGPPGYAHGGVIAAALDDAMAVLLHASGKLAVTRSIEVDFRAPVPVGVFVVVEAEVERREEGRVWLRSIARTEGEGATVVAEATAQFKELGDLPPEALSRAT